ncbi:hypothetical protein BKA70DRAFT_1314413 [Coprinopsis sp. MPI-PUGE-AT-0042]|nr:hypothetical protein BKA70DRAFT_1314413 [Coprinopsis sp. MPI-PUGE-AT-0042]
MGLEQEAFLESNNGIPASLSSICREQLRDLEASIKVVDEKSSLLEVKLRALLSDIEALDVERAELTMKKTTIEYLLAPIRKLPNELLANIFQSAIGLPAFMDEHDREALTTIRCVCKRWDGFWRNLRIGTQASVHNTKKLASQLASWFSRGGERAPLRLSLGCTVHPYNQLAHRRFVDVIDLHLRLGMTCLVTLVSAINKSEFKPWSSLKRLALDISADTWGNRVIDLGFDGQALPALEQIHLSFQSLRVLQGVHTSLVPSIRVIHPSVTSLCLSRTTIVNLTWLPAFLRAENFPAIRILILQDLRFTDDPNQLLPTSPAEVLPVERLIVRGEESLLALNYLTLPSTKFLQFVDIAEESCFPPEPCAAAIFGFLRRSQLYLETLSLDQTNLYFSIQGDMIHSLKACQTLQIPWLSAFAPACSPRLPSSNPLVKTIICTSPIFELERGFVAWPVEEELKSHLQARSRVPGIPKLTIVSPDTSIPEKQYWTENGWKEFGTLIQEGRVRFLSTVDDLDPDEATILKPYRTEGSFDVAI